jgi:hypothetical protein
MFHVEHFRLPILPLAFGGRLNGAILAVGLEVALALPKPTRVRESNETNIQLGCQIPAPDTTAASPPAFNLGLRAGLRVPVSEQARNPTTGNFPNPPKFLSEPENRP